MNSTEDDLVQYLRRLISRKRRIRIAVKIFIFAALFIAGWFLAAAFSWFLGEAFK